MLETLEPAHLYSACIQAGCRSDETDGNIPNMYSVSQKSFWICLWVEDFTSHPWICGLQS